MTEQEQDKFFFDTLKKILIEKKENDTYLRKQTGDEWQDVIADNQDDIKLLGEILSSCKTIEDLAEKDEETVGLVFEFLEEYADSFVISEEDGIKDKDMQEYTRLEEILDLFYGDEEEEEE